MKIVGERNINISGKDIRFEKKIEECIDLENYLIVETFEKKRNVYGINKTTGEMWQVGSMWEAKKGRRFLPSYSPDDEIYNGTDDGFIGIKFENEMLQVLDWDHRWYEVDIETGNIISVLNPAIRD